MRMTRLGLAVVTFAAAGCLGRRACAEDTWQVDVGVVRQWGVKMQVEGPPSSLPHDPWFMLPGQNSRVVLEQTKGARPGAADVAPPTDDGQLTDRRFSDGFVLLDVWTLDAGVPQERYGMTWNWGYQNASQYNSNNLTLTFHRATSVTASARVTDSAVYEDEQTTREVTCNQAVDESDSNSASGVEVNAKRRMDTWGKWQLALKVGAAWFPDVESQVSANPLRMLIRQNTYRVTGEEAVAATYRESYNETYTYADHFGLSDPSLPPLPDVVGTPPYFGPADPYNGPGPLIPNSPTNYVAVKTGSALTEVPVGGSESQSLVGSRIWLISDTVQWDAELNRVRLVCGPDLSREAKGRLRLHVSPQLTLSLVDADVERRETGTVTDAATGRVVSTARRTSHGSKTDCILGLLLLAGADTSVTEDWVVSADVGYEWMGKKVSVDVGPDRAEFDLGGWEAGLRVGRSF